MVLLIVILIFTIYLVCGLKIVKEPEKCIVFTSGKYTTILEPGLRFIWPIFQSTYKINLNKNTDEISAELNNLNIPSEVIRKVLDETRKLNNSNTQYNESVRKD